MAAPFIEIPTSLDRVRRFPGGAAWLADLPRRVDLACAHWDLELGAPYPGSFVSLVLPACRSGAPVVLKLQWPHDECRFEADALRHWTGRGAVRLVDHLPECDALLLERCQPGEALASADLPLAAKMDIVAGLLRQTCIPAGAPFDCLEAEALCWAEGLEASWQQSGRPCPRRLVDAAKDMLRTLAAHPDGPVLLHQDLHGGNVLSAERAPWLVIDPKPLIGDPAFAPAPVIRSFEFGHSRTDVLYRLDHLSDALELDRKRVRAWTIGQTLAWGFSSSFAEQHLATAAWLAEER